MIRGEVEPMVAVLVVLALSFLYVAAVAYQAGKPGGVEEGCSPGTWHVKSHACNK